MKVGSRWRRLFNTNEQFTFLDHPVHTDTISRAKSSGDRFLKQPDSGGCRISRLGTDRETAPQIRPSTIGAI